MSPYLCRFSLFHSLWLLCAFVAHTLNAQPTADGLYAAIQTSEGTFYAQLDYDKAPLTVANFVGLATGEKSWIDPINGAVSNAPFYNGLLIPRVEPGFVIQMGSPFNTTSGGPGYNFPDEFHIDLLHDAAGILSMANSSINTNGSQFFITLGAFSSLDSKHSVFGSVVEGMNIVTAISNQPAGSVTIIDITILRIGTAANAFDSSQWHLPEVQGVEINQLTVDTSTDTYDLDFDRSTFTQYAVNHSNDLQTWAAIQDNSLTHFSENTPATLDVSAVSIGEPKKFFRIAAANYPTAPSSVNGLTIDLHYTNNTSNEVLSLSFTDEPRSSYDIVNPLGSYTFDTSTASIGAYLWDLKFPSGQLIVSLESFGRFVFFFKFHPDGTGTFTGLDYDYFDGTSPFFGNFTWQATP
ncbi:MAG: peptidylprolyl isomerase [Opitutaceae bacterium]